MPRFETALPPFLRDRPSERRSSRDAVQAHDKGWRQDAKQRAKGHAPLKKFFGEAAEAREIRPPLGRERSDMALIAAI